MAQRTIAEARQHLTDIADGLNPESYARIEAEIVEAERAATTRAQTFINDEFTKATAVGNEAVATLCELRDRANALVVATKAGRLSATDANDQLIALRSEYRETQRRAANLQEKADLIEAIEDDPVGWVDNMSTKFPSVRPSFTF